MSTTLPLTAGTLPQGICSVMDSEQARLNIYAQYLSVVIDDTDSHLILSAAKPADTSVAWGKLDANGNLVRIYVYVNGSWVAPHPLMPGFTMIWTDALPDFTTFDGGDAGAPGDYTGPMWDLSLVLHGTNVPATLVSRFPISVGTIPSAVSSPTPTAVAVAGTGGEDVHVLLAAEGGPHQHAVAKISQDKHQLALEVGGNFRTSIPGYAPGGSGDVTPAPVADTGAFGDTYLTTEYGDNSISAGSLKALTGHNNLPPFVGVYFLRRTTRLWFVEP